MNELKELTQDEMSLWMLSEGEAIRIEGILFNSLEGAKYLEGKGYFKRDEAKKRLEELEDKIACIKREHPLAEDIARILDRR